MTLSFRYLAGAEARHIEPVETPPDEPSAWREAAAFLCGGLEVVVAQQAVGSSVAGFLCQEFVPLLEALERVAKGNQLEWRAFLSEVPQESRLLLYEHEAGVEAILQLLTPHGGASSVRLSKAEATSILCRLARDSSDMLQDALLAVYGQEEGARYCVALAERVEAVCSSLEGK